MYCRNCGQKLADGDKFCSSCGAKTILTNESDKIEESVQNIEAEAPRPQAESTIEKGEPLFEPFDFKSLGLDLDLGSEPEPVQEEAEEPKKPTAPVEDFDWNIHTFPGMGVEKTEDIDFNWSMSPDEVEEEKPAEPAQASPKEAEAEPEAVPSEDLQWKPKEAATSEKTAEKEPEAASSLEEELFGGLDSKTDETKKQAEEIDKFFTFHKKNEEFQKLLDQEYEKIKSGNILTEEMNTAAAASEEKFASRQPEDPMEELFASEGVVKSYEPKPVETDVLERIEAAEAEKKAREEAAKLIEEEKAKAREEAAKRAAEEAEAAARAKEAEEAARMRLEEEAKRAADARAAQEAAERERARAAAREEAEAAIRAAEEKAEQARKEAEAKLAEQTAKLQAEAEARKAEAERKAREAAEAAARAKAEAEERAKAEAEAAARAAAEKDPANHISEMVRARETFFGQEAALGQDQPKKQQEAPEPEQAEGIPEKTKAVDKAAILAGMATASEMVQRDRAFAAAQAAEEAARAAQQAEEAEAEAEAVIDFTDFLGQLEEEEAEVPVSEPEELILEPDTEDFSITEIEEPEQDLSGIVLEEPEEAIQPEAEDLDELQADLFSIEDLIGEDESERQEADLKPEKQVTDETLIMTADSVADLLNNQMNEEENQAVDHTMVFPADFNLTETEEEAAEPSQETPVEQETDTFGDFEDDDYEEEHGGKGRIVLKICLVILIVLLVMEIAGVVIKVAAPTSGAAKFIDTQLNNVIQLFTGDDDTEYSMIYAAEDVRQEPIEDKTSLIKAEMGKNKDGNIQSIEYNADLKFDPDKSYDNTDLNLTQNLADVTWYKDASNKQVYYDQAIVGAMIAYDSQKVNLINNNDSSVLNLMKTGTDLYKEVKALGGQGATETFKSLQIGEIRQAGSLYYIWVAEKVENTQSGSSDTKKIYEMEPDGQVMKVVASYEA
ncbi:zinc-ribbon domain-containing protein [bacterium 210820-DFI.6.37]|nr:zinc-ribbon domain-containing protein [bacterium 210820-DFI.6.37]